MLNIYNANNHDQTPLVGGTVELNKKPNYQKYTDPTGEFSGQELKYSFWYVRHRLVLYKAAIGVLLALAVGTALYSLFQLGTYLIFGLQESAAVDRGLTTFENYTAIQDRFAPKPIQILGTTVYAGSGSKYDFVAEASNPNSQFIVTFEYHFTYNSNQQTPSQTTTLLAGEARPLPFLGLETSGYPSTAAIVIEHIAWKRLSNHEYLDPAAFQSTRLNFLVSNFVFTPASDGVVANADSIRFSLTNQSAYSYKSAQFYVGLYLDQNLVGILPLTIDAFKSLETKQVDLRSFGSNVNVTDVRVFPVINTYDPSVYLPPDR